MMRKFVSTVAIILGIAILAYPAAMDKYNEYRRKELMESWERSMRYLDVNREEEAVDGIEGPAAGEEENPEQSGELDGEEGLQEEDALKKQREEQEQQERERLEKYIAGNMDGMLRIPKIDLYLPVLSGATEDNLNISAASIENTGKPGEIGNYCVAGHRVRKYGQHFNRLDELETGDIIEFEAGKEKYEYVIFDKFVVNPTEVWVINKTSRTEREITLITCYPLVNPTQRLIIKGRMEKGT